MSKARISSAPKRLAEDGDICNVCKSSRYLNPNMRFLVNPECYHKMCESCVDRIFSHGPAPCPIAGCKRTLRKAKFRTQTFEDLKVEREVDIRRRVAKAMDKQESDFETLLDYNNYLEAVEETTWNLILGHDVAETERKLRLWEQAQKAELNPNATFRHIDDQANTSTLSESSHVILKKGGTQRKGGALAAAGNNTSDPFGGDDAAKDTGFVFAGLKKREAPKPEAPFDPYGGWGFEPQYYTLQEPYDTPSWLEATINDHRHMGGGWVADEYYRRTIRDAFSGMGIFIEEELTAKENAASGDAGIGTQHAAGAALGMRDVDMQDVF